MEDVGNFPLNSVAIVSLIFVSSEFFNGTETVLNYRSRAFIGKDVVYASRGCVAIFSSVFCSNVSIKKLAITGKRVWIGSRIGRLAVLKIYCRTGSKLSSRRLPIIQTSHGQLQFGDS